MKKLFALTAGLVLVQALSFAQTPKDPQTELNQAQQKIRSLQAADQQIKSQVVVLRKDQAKLEADVQKSVTSSDSLMNATMDSIRVSNVRSLNNEKETAGLRSSLSLQQNLIIVALVLVICLFLLFLLQRRMLRTLAAVHESDLKSMAGKIELQAGELSTKISRLQDLQAEAVVKTEEKISYLRTSLSAEISGIREILDQTAGKIRDEHRAGIGEEMKKREEGMSGLNMRFAALDEKLDTGLDAAISHIKVETENHRKETAEIRKTLQEVVKNQKTKGNSVV